VPPSRALRTVVPQARQQASRQAGSSPRGHRNGRRRPHAAAGAAAAA